MNDTNNTDANTRTQIRGLCAACGCIQAVTGGLLAPHGYTRPWDGAGNIGACWGSRKRPHEVSPEVAEEAKASLVEALKLRQSILADLFHPDMEEVVVFRRGLGGKQVAESVKRAEAPAWKWDEAVRGKVCSLESEMKHIRYAQERVNALLVDWRPGVLAQVQVETAEGKAARKRDAIPAIIPEEVTLRNLGGFAIYHAGGRNYAVVRLSDRKVIERCSSAMNAQRAIYRLGKPRA
jgi:hypothetical protein